jgi:MFS transporter, DHA2 family, multidrug resistance protein
VIKDCMKRNVFSIPSTATIRQAAALVAERHIGLLPVVDAQAKPIGVIRLGDLLSLELPDFFKLLPDFDFVHDFGAVETTRPSPAELERPVTTLMQPGLFVDETCGLLRAYALLVKHNLHDLPVVSEDGVLVGIASRVDIGAAILSIWKTVPSSRL